MKSEGYKRTKNNADVINIGKEKTFDYFFHHYYTALSFFAQSIIHNEEDAKDIVSDCFIKLWSSADTIRKTDTIKSFLYTMVRNRCIDYVRRKKVATKATNYLQTIEGKPEYFDELAFAEMMRQIFDHVEDLPNKTRTILKKHYMEGKKIKEIATELGSTPDAVRAQNKRALKLLRRKLLPFSAIKLNYYWNRLFKRLFDIRKNKEFALIAGCNKLLKQVFGVVKNQTLFNNSYLKNSY